MANDTNGVSDVFLRDTCIGASSCTPSTIRLSVSDAGAQGNGASSSAMVSGDGNYIVFASAASNLVLADTNTQQDVFVKQRR